MAYATQDDLIARYGTPFLIDLTDRGDVATGAIDADAVTRALASASAEIDGYLARRYRLPVSEVPEPLKKLACVLAIWELHTFDPSDKIVADHKKALARLKEIAEGTFRLPIDGAEPATTGTSGARTTDRDRPMEASKLTGFI